MTRILAVAIVLLLHAASPLFAQDPKPRTYESNKAASLTVFGGGISGSSGSGGVLGWSAGWMPSPRWAIEGGGWWTDEPSTDGFTALIGPRFNLTLPRRVTPFVSGEFGVFHTTVDARDPDVPQFYRDRIDGPPFSDTFDDFTTAVGGGVEVVLHGNITMRPQVRILFISGDGAMRTTTVWGAHLSYNFKERSSSPTR